MKTSNIAIQQALVLELGYSLRQAGEIMGISHRSVSLHVCVAQKYGNCKPWHLRSEENRQSAIKEAEKRSSNFPMPPRGQCKGRVYGEEYYKKEPGEI